MFEVGRLSTGWLNAVPHTREVSVEGRGGRGWLKLFGRVRWVMRSGKRCRERGAGSYASHR